MGEKTKNGSRRVKRSKGEENNGRKKRKMEEGGLREAGEWRNNGRKKRKMEVGGLREARERRNNGRKNEKWK